MPYARTPSKNLAPVSRMQAYIAYLFCRCCHIFSTPLVRDPSIAPGHRNRSKAGCLVSLAASPVGRGTLGHRPTPGPWRGPPGPTGQKRSLPRHQRWPALRRGARPFGQALPETGSPERPPRSARPQVAPSPGIRRRLPRQTSASCQHIIQRNISGDEDR